MATKDDGGPAFPVERIYNGNGDEITEYGMSLRDWFAGQALSAMGWISPNDVSRVSKARDAYAQADAMLAARKVES